MYETVAAKLQLSPQGLERESLRLFLDHQLRLIETQLLHLGHKYGVITIHDLDQLVQKGMVHEQDAFEDYFEFDYLESKRDVLLDSLATLQD